MSYSHYQDENIMFREVYIDGMGVNFFAREIDRSFLVKKLMEHLLCHMCIHFAKIEQGLFFGAKEMI